MAEGGDAGLSDHLLAKLERIVRRREYVAIIHLLKYPRACRLRETFDLDIQIPLVDRVS